MTTLTELTKIIIETIDETEEDIHHYADLMQKIVSVTIQVMEALKGVNIDMNTRDLKQALLAQKIVQKIEVTKN